MDGEKIFARKSAPPPPSPEQFVPEQDTDQQHHQQREDQEANPPSSFSGEVGVDGGDFLMDIDEPYPIPTSPSSSRRTPLRANPDLPPISSKPRKSSGAGKRNKQAKNKTGKENIVDPPQLLPDATNQQPDVDELLASLEATVQNNNNNNNGNTLHIKTSDANNSNNNNNNANNTEADGPPILSREGDPPLPSRPPLPAPPLPRHPDPSASPSAPPAATAPSQAFQPQGENQDAAGGKGKKRKPRNSRQTKKKMANAGSQRTEGVGSSSSGNAPTSSSSVPSSSSQRTDSSASEGAARSARKQVGSDEVFPSHNRKWLANTPQTTQSPKGAPTPGEVRPSPAASASGYQRNPSSVTVCKDISSFKFIPDDDERVELVLHSIHGEPGPIGLRQKSVVSHNFPTVFSADVTGVPTDQAPGAHAVGDNESFITVADFAHKFPDIAILHSVPKKTSVTFLVLYRPMNSRKRWLVPNFETAADFINDSLCQMYHSDAPFADVYDRSGKWGLFSTLLLKSDCAENIEEFRRHLVKWTYKGMDYDTFPKEVVTMKPDLTILLRSNMKSFQLEVLPKVLFSRNKDRLAGSLRVLSTKMFLDGETSHKGEAKENWRQISLKGDEQVLRCLRFIPESSPFLLGVEAVQIRGGLRPQDPSDHILGKRSRTDLPAPPPNILAPLPTSLSNRGGNSKRSRGNKRGSFPRAK